MSRRSRKKHGTRSGTAAARDLIIPRVLLVLWIGLQILGMNSPQGRTWGIHLGAFVPLWAVALVLGSTLILALLPRRLLNGLYDSITSRIIVKWFWPVVGVALPAGFYFFREAYAFLGDGRLRGREAQADVIWSTELVPGVLANWIHDVTKTSWALDGWESLAGVSVIAGAAFLLFLWLLGRRVWREPAERSIGRLFIGSSALLALFFGYIESYALPCALMIGFLLAAEGHRRGNLSFFLAPVLFIMSIAAHFATVVLYPALAVLAWKSPGHRPVKIVTTGGVGIIAALWGVWSFFLSPYARAHPERTMLLDLLPNEMTQYGFFSFTHWLDFGNLVLLVVPGLLIIIPLLIFHSRRQKSQQWSGFWFAAVLFPLAIPLFLDPKLGAARDWDLLSLGLVPAVVWGAVRLADLPKTVPRGLKLIPIYIQLTTTVLFVSINASSATGIDRFETLLEIDQTRGGYGHEVAAEFYRMNENAEKEIYHWHQAAFLENNKRYWGGLALACMRAKDYNFALQAAYRCRALDSMWAEGAYYVASAYHELGNFDSANHYFNVTLDLNPRHHGARHDRAMLLMKHGKPAEALYEIENALAISPDSAIYLGVRGWVLMELKRFDEAEHQLKDALLMDPDIIHAQINLARLYDQTGRHNQALQEINTVLNRSILPTGLRPTLENIRSDILEKMSVADTTG